jgi:DNA-3-methyladenine glycosylase II
MQNAARQIKEKNMGLPADRIRADLDALGSIEPRFAAAVAAVGYPEPRIRQPGYVTLFRTIVGQQVSFKAAASIWGKLETGLLATGFGDIADPHTVLSADADTLRGYGLSRQKQSYVLSLAERVASGALPLDNLPEDDEDAIALLTSVKGIGRWSAEVYLLFAEGRADIWPAGDLAVQISVGGLMGLTERPSEKHVRALAEAWRPFRGAAAIFAWHHYKTQAI